MKRWFLNRHKTALNLSRMRSALKLRTLSATEENIEQEAVAGIEAERESREHETELETVVASSSLNSTSEPNLVVAKPLTKEEQEEMKKQKKFEQSQNRLERMRTVKSEAKIKPVVPTDNKPLSSFRIPVRVKAQNDTVVKQKATKVRKVQGR